MQGLPADEAGRLTKRRKFAKIWRSAKKLAFFPNILYTQTTYNFIISYFYELSPQSAPQTQQKKHQKRQGIGRFNKKIPPQ